MRKSSLRSTSLLFEGLNSSSYWQQHHTGLPQQRWCHSILLCSVCRCGPARCEPQEWCMHAKSWRKPTWRRGEVRPWLSMRNRYWRSWTVVLWWDRCSYAFQSDFYLFLLKTHVVNSVFCQCLGHFLNQHIGLPKVNKGGLFFVALK